MLTLPAGKSGEIV